MTDKAGIRGGIEVSRTELSEFSGLFSPSESGGVLEAAFLLKKTGIALASWSRDPLPQEVVSVMAATMWGSLDTMVRTLGGEGPRSALVEVESHRILAMQVEPNFMLLLVAPRSVGKTRLRQEAHTIVTRVARVRVKPVPRHSALDGRD